MKENFLWRGFFKGITVDIIFYVTLNYSKAFSTTNIFIKNQLKSFVSNLLRFAKIELQLGLTNNFQGLIR